jgi:hypothetical protein
LEDAVDRGRQLDEILEAGLAGASLAPIDAELRALIRLAAEIHLAREALLAERRAALKHRVLRSLDLAPRPSLDPRSARA